METDISSLGLRDGKPRHRKEPNDFPGKRTDPCILFHFRAFSIKQDHRVWRKWSSIMEIIGKAVHQEPGGNMTVEFVAQGGDVVSVHIRKTDDDNLNRLNAEERAKVMLGEVAGLETIVEMAEALPDGNREASSGESPAVTSLRSARSAQDTGTLEEHLQEGLEASFPGSDPVSASFSSISGSGPTTRH